MDFRTYLDTETVGRVDYRRPVWVASTATVAEAIDLMRRQQVGCVLVMDQGRLAGIVTERDVLGKVLAGTAGVARGEPVTRIMTADPVTVRVGDSLGCLFRRMFEGGFRHLPVIDDHGQLLGTVSIKRVVRFLADQFPEIVYNIPPVPEKFGAAREGA
jgi:CBS domain-containing protein